MAALPDGSVALVWVAKTAAGALRLEASVLPAGGTAWSKPEAVPGSDGVDFGQSNVPRVAAGPDGSLFVVWTESDASGKGSTPMLVQRSPSGTWATPTPARTLPPRAVTVNTTNGQETDYTGGVQPEVAALPDGRAVVVWQDDEKTLDANGAGAWDVYFGIWDPATKTWTASAPTGADRISNLDLQPIALAAAKDGLRLVYDATAERVRGQTLNVSGTTWSAPADVPTPDGTKTFDLHLAAGVDGGLLLTWRSFSTADQTEDVAAALLPASGGGWTALPPAAHFTNTELYDPTGALDAAGQPVALWTDDSSTPGVVMAAAYGSPSTAAAPATPNASAAMPGVTGDRYTSPQYGYRLTWSAPWRADQALSDASTGYDLLSLTDGVSSVYLQGFAFTGDAATCLNQAAAHYQTDPGYSHARPALGANDQAQLDPAEASAVYDYTYTDQNGTATDYTAYLACRPLPGGKAALVITQAAPAAAYDNEVAAREALLAGLTP